MIRNCPGLACLLAACCLVFSAGCAIGLGGGQMPLPEDPLAELEGLSPRPAAAQTSQLSPAEFSTELARGRNLERAGKYDQARQIYQRLLSANPQRYEPYHRLGVVADQQRRHREAQALYTQAIRLCGNDAELFNDLGYCLYLQGNLEKAETALLKAVTLRPASSRYRNNLGLVLGHQGRCDEALEQFRRGGSEADAHYNLAFVYAAQNDIEKAKQCFRLAIAADPAHEAARGALASFDRYDQDPESLPEFTQLAEDGGRWVPYTEGDQPQDGDQAGDAVQLRRPNSQALLKQARSMVGQRMAARQE
jgi:Flp pilus assembly protein TadD